MNYELKATPLTMANGEKIRNVKITLADNGFIICYDQYEEDSKNTYDGMSYCGEKQLVFPFAEQKNALDKFVELGKASGKLKAVAEKSEESEGSE